MTAQQLKNSILQLAVQGKLVPQDPTDEPASVLLERIRAEKEKLIKEGKIKKEKNPSVIFRGTDNTPYEKIGNAEPVSIADEVPFDIPDSWEWVRIKDVFKIEMGQSPDGNSVNEAGDGVEFHQGKVYFGKEIILKSPQSTNAPTKFADNGSVLLCVRAPVGKVNKTDRKICIGRGLCSLMPLGGISSDFVFYLTQMYEDIFVKQATGTTFVAITGETVKNQLVPIPPLKEQLRIVDRIKAVLPLVEEYDYSFNKSKKLEKEFPVSLKKSILQYAVQGKLVPQDENDEPASVLLERIHAEKQRLIAEGKIKKDKNESVIFRRDNSHYEKLGDTERCIDDEIPYEIPNSWEWVCFSNVIELQSGQDMPPSKYNAFGNGIPYITGASNIDNGKVIINRWTTEPKACAYKGDLLLTCKGTVGTMAILKESEVHIARQIMAIRPVAFVNINYIQIVLFSLVAELKAVAKSMIPGISRDDVLDALIPLPPISEQNRIVAEIEKLLPVLKNLEK